MTHQRFPACIESAFGLRALVNANGSIHRLEHRGIVVNLFPGNELEGGPANLWLRRLGAHAAHVPLLGPRSPGTVHVGEDRLQLSGSWQGITFRVCLVLSAAQPAWFWHVELQNLGDADLELDLIHTQDLALAPYASLRLNEYYVSHYVDHTPLAHAQQGVVIASRQNQPVEGRHPWCAIGSLRRGVGFGTDMLQWQGLAARAGDEPAALLHGLPNRRLQHEHAMAMVQDAPLRLAPGERTRSGFFGGLLVHHPQASGDADLSFIDELLALPEALMPPEVSVPTFRPEPASLFSAAPALPCSDLSQPQLEALFGADWRHAERDEAGRLLSFFAGRDSHVVLRAKELRALRPHGHILRTGHATSPDEAALTSTVWMGGVFHSMLTQGHVSINRFLSTTRGYLGLFRSHGLRVFVDIGGTWRLLDLPSAFEMRPQACRWIYRHAGGTIELRSDAAGARHEMSLQIAVLEGGPQRFLLSHHIALHGDDGAAALRVAFTRDAQGVCVGVPGGSELFKRFPAGTFRIDTQDGTTLESVGGDELLFIDGQSRQQPYVCLVATASESSGFRFTGQLVDAALGDPGPDIDTSMTAGVRLYPPAGSPFAQELARIEEILPWFAHDALVHYLSPRGLEQYSGGGWGTRDVTQGPVEMMFALGRLDVVRDLLLRVFAAQNVDGDWPQWFMFFERERHGRASDAHGDIVFWPVLALAQYLCASRDATMLLQELPFYSHDAAETETFAPLWVHLDRALGVIARRMIPGTHLAAYGHGDWNDSLQPADPAMRDRLCSAWTVTLHHQTLSTLALAHQGIGSDDAALRFREMAGQVLADFQRLLVIDGVLAGFALFPDDAPVEYLLHPRDLQTGLHYSALGMIHAVINEMFTPDQAREHLGLIERELSGPHGVHLFDRPMRYRGGVQTHFQRAETSAFFGREIGLMYMHGHLRYAEALWRFGDAEGFFRALCLANPIGMPERVAGATLRQSNCYYSSSDAGFADRYEASAEFERVRDGTVALEGGWRVYSSGAGIALSLVLRCLLGLRWEHDALVIDPVIPAALDGLQAEVELGGYRLQLSYHVEAQGCGPRRIELNGTALAFERETNRYRDGAAHIPMRALLPLLDPGSNRLAVMLG